MKKRKRGETRKLENHRENGLRKKRWNLIELKLEQHISSSFDFLELLKLMIKSKLSEHLGFEQKSEELFFLR